MSAPTCQLYLISPLDVGGDFPARLERALSAGPVAAFQFRVKGVDQHEAARLAEPLQAICARHEVAFIVNDSIALAKRLHADGVHLGQGDGDVREARQELGREAQIGVTCHASRHLAIEAAEAGADYVAFGSFFSSSTKVSEHRPAPELLTWWQTFIEIPVRRHRRNHAGQLRPDRRGRRRLHCGLKRGLEWRRGGGGQSLRRIDQNGQLTRSSLSYTQ